MPPGALVKVSGFFPSKIVEIAFEAGAGVPIDSAAARRCALRACISVVRCDNSCMNHLVRIVRPESERRGCPNPNPWRPAI
jgi:hypothetical protein